LRYVGGTTEGLIVYSLMTFPREGALVVDSNLGFRVAADPVAPGS
jgi:hypothetical protein